MPLLKQLGLAALAAASVTAAEGEWNQWRGSNRDGVAAGVVGPGVWPDTLSLVWRMEVGEGHASPIVAHGRIFLHSRIGERELVWGIDLESGERIWQDAYEAPYEMNSAAMAHGKGPKATPATDGSHVVTVGITGVVSCYSVHGKLLWRRNFWEDYQETAPEFGTAASPVIDGDIVYAHVGGDGSGAILALSIADGRVRWRWEGDGPGYTSPIIIEVGGVKVLVTESQSYRVALEAESGKVLWQVPFSTPYDQNVITPVVFDGDKVVFSGLDQGTTAYQFARTGEKLRARQLWHNSDISMYMSSPVLVDSMLYGMAKRRSGQFFCLDVRTGELAWESEGRQGDNAAFIRAGKALLVLTTDAELKIIQPSGEAYRLLTAYHLSPTPTWAHPAVVDDRIIIKDATDLWMWRTSPAKN